MVIKTKKIISLAVILTGMTAMASQIILMREFLVVFYGNEVTLGLILASWLIWGAIGSGFFGRFAGRIGHKMTFYAFCQLAVGILLPLNIFFIRSVRPIFGVSTGEMISFTPMVLATLIILAPLCILSGFMFSLACRLYETEPPFAASRIGRVYYLEAIGAMAAGTAVSFILVRLLSALNIMVLLGLINILSAFCLQFCAPKNKFKPVYSAVFSLFFIAAVSLWLFKGWDKIEQDSLKKQWQGYTLIAARNSLYGNIVLAKRAEQVTFFNNGLPLYTPADKLTAEGAVHFPILEHPHPESVLLVGGGVGGLTQELLKYPLKKIDYLELDPLIIEMAKDYLPEADYLPLKEQRVMVRNLDGRFFIKRALQKYDCVIVHLGSPHTAQLNRFYTVEFFQEAKKILKEGGIFSFAVTSSENYISRQLGDFLRSLYFSLNAVFAEVKVIPGETAYFLATDKKGMLTYDYRALMERARGRNIGLQYMREYYFSSSLSKERLGYLEGILKKKGTVKLNHDFRPVAYYYDMVFWLAYFKDSLFSKALAAVTEGRIWAGMLLVYLFILLWGLAKRRNKGYCQKAALLAVMTTGFAELSFQIVILFSFQLIYGFLFYRLGLILTAFMLGLIFGSLWMSRWLPKLKRGLAIFTWTQVSICLYPLLLPLVFRWLSRAQGETVSWLGANVIFPVLPVIAGCIGGLQFPLANKIYLGKREDAGGGAGLSYGMDLFGSSLGAFFTAAFLVPVLGVFKTCLVSAGLNFIVLILLWSCREDIIDNA